MGPFGRPLPPFLQGMANAISNIVDDIKKKSAPKPVLSPFSFPRLSLFSDLPEMPEIEIIELDDEPELNKPTE